MIISNKILSDKIYINRELQETFSNNEPKCSLFGFCNCKTAACRVMLPDESCYWYRYFKKIIEENE